jgi:hypothetical protein
VAIPDELSEQSSAQLVNMYSTLTTLIDRLDSPAIAGTGVIEWGCPVPSFGDLCNAEVASLGLNPSNREFMDERGEELDGSLRRFHTLNSLGLKSWGEVNAWHLRLIIEACRSYFLANPYDGWFKRLDQVISATGASFYRPRFGACHLDLIPYATTRKWTELSSRQRSMLLDVAGDTLGLLLRDSSVRILLLNGQSVVDQFQEIGGIRLDREQVPDWTLPRERRTGVAGVAYSGMVSRLCGIGLGHDVLVLGYNHNIQSSFGVTKNVVRAIRDWLSNAAFGTPV